MAFWNRKKQKKAPQPQPTGKHLAKEPPATSRKTVHEQKADERTGRPRDPEKRQKSATAPPRQETAAARRAARVDNNPASGRRPARPHQQRESAHRVNARALYNHFLPYIENAHKRNQRSLKAGVWMLVLLPVVLVIIRALTDASKIAFLILWIVGMFGIATALIFTAYADHDLKKTLDELKSIVPPEQDVQIGNLLPVDAEGEGWLIDPEELPIPLPDLKERLPEISERINQQNENLKERIASRESALQNVMERRPKHLAKDEAAPDSAERRQPELGSAEAKRDGNRRPKNADMKTSGKESHRKQNGESARRNTPEALPEKPTGGKHLKQE